MLYSPLGKLRSKLHALRFASRKRSGGLTDLNISKSNVEEGLELTLKLRQSLEEGYSLLYRHFKNVVYALALVLYVKRIAIVAFASAYVAFYVNVGQEVHLNAFYTVTLARLASTAAYVE